MKKLLAIAAVLVMAMSYSGATLAQQVYLLAPDAAGNAKAMEKRAAKEGKRAEKMVAKERAEKLKDGGSFDDDSQGSDDEGSSGSSEDDESSGSSEDDESSGSSEDDSSDNKERIDSDSDSADDKNLSRNDRADEAGAHGRDKAKEIRGSNKARQAEKRELVEDYKSLSKEERDALTESGGDETGNKKKAKKPWWKFWDN